MPALKWDWTDFLTDKEKKEMKSKLPKGVPSPAKFIDWSKAQPISYTAEEIRELNAKSREQVEQLDSNNSR